MTRPPETPEDLTSARKRQRGIFAKIQEFVLSMMLVALGILIAASPHVSLESRFLILAAFLGCVLYSILDDEKALAVIRKRIRKD